MLQKIWRFLMYKIETIEDKNKALREKNPIKVQLWDVLLINGLEVFVEKIEASRSENKYWGVIYESYYKNYMLLNYAKTSKLYRTNKQSNRKTSQKNSNSDDWNFRKRTQKYFKICFLIGKY